MSERVAGWYWVSDDQVYWKPCRWCPVSPGWAVGKRQVEDESFYPFVGDRIPEPDEPWQCVPVEPTEHMLFKAETAAMNKEVDCYSPTPTEHPDDGGGPSGYYYRALLAAAPKP